MTEYYTYADTYICAVAQALAWKTVQMLIQKASVGGGIPSTSLIFCEKNDQHHCPHLSHQGTDSLARKAQKHDWHILHETTTKAVPPSRLKSRHPYNRTAQGMLGSIPEDMSARTWPGGRNGSWLSPQVCTITS